MATWLPMFALPSIEVRHPIEVDGFALASIHDARIQELADRHPNFQEFLNRFTTEFGVRLVPSIFICRDDAPLTYRGVDAIAGFRDALAMSVIPQSWAKVLRYQNNMGIKYANHFAVYPWMLDANYNYIVTKTLNLLGLHVVTELQGQCPPALSREILDIGQLDQPLLDALLYRWQRGFRTKKLELEDVRLFRSLNMANAAAMLPAGAEATSLDIGRSVALWSSAFEILTPAKNETYREVYALLDRISWNYTPCKEPKYEAYGYPRDRTLRNLPSWIFGAINHARNDYLHGNPITGSRLIVPPAKQPLHIYTSLLYRMALAAFVKVKQVVAPSMDDQAAYEAYRRDYFAIGRYQSDIEIALSTIMLSDEEVRARRGL